MKNEKIAEKEYEKIQFFKKRSPAHSRRTGRVARSGELTVSAVWTRTPKWNVDHRIQRIRLYLTAEFHQFRTFRWFSIELFIHFVN